MKRIFSYLVLLIVCSSCVNKLEDVEALNQKDVGVEVARHIHTYYYGANGNLKGILTAPVLYRYMLDTPYIELNEGLKVVFYNDSLQEQSVLTAKKGRYFENSDIIVVSDSVVVTTKDGKRLETDELHWDPEKQHFYTKKPVKLTTASQVIYGKHGLIAPPDISWYQFNSASGDIKVDSTFQAHSNPPRDSVSKVQPPVQQDSLRKLEERQIIPQ